MTSEFKKLIQDIKCGRVPSPVFSDDDLAKVKACLPEPVAQPAKVITPPVIDDKPSCVNDGVEQIKKIMNEQLVKQPIAIEFAIHKLKLEEALDHYQIIQGYYSERLKFFNDTITTLTPFTSQYLYWDSEYLRLKALVEASNSTYQSNILLLSYQKTLATNLTRVIELGKESDLLRLHRQDGYSLTTLLNFYDSGILVPLGLVITSFSQDFRNLYDLVIAMAEAYERRFVAKQGGTNALASRIQDLPSLSSTSTEVASELTAITQLISGQLIPAFNNIETPSNVAGIVYPSRTAVFGIRTIDLVDLQFKLPLITPEGKSTQVDRTIQLLTTPVYTGSPFSPTIATYHENRSSKDGGDPLKSDPTRVPGALYTLGPNGYIGLYRKLANPVRFLYTPEERGLSVNPNKIDSAIRDIQNAPVSITEEGTTLYIKSQAQYEAFYETAQQTLPAKIKKEREEIFPAAVRNQIDQLADYARREVADFFRRTTDVVIRLARPVNYTAAGSNIFLAGTFEYDSLDQVLSSRLAYYTKAADQVNQRIALIKSNIEALDKKIRNNSLDPDVIVKKISALSCFKEAAKAKVTNKDCEAKTRAKLGKDPLMLRTLGGVDATMPDMNNPCYWKEFANSLNKLSILPIPDTTSPLFRYYPINNIIPTPTGIVLTPIPTKWTPIFSLSTPLGTLVTFLTMPKLILGLPLPSVYVLYFAPDSNKYLLAAPNIPLLYSPPNAIKYGFELDDSGASDNPIGLSNSNPNKGQFVKGSLTVPIKLGATAQKAIRLTSFAATIAAGRKFGLTDVKGNVFAELSLEEYTKNYLSAFEKMSATADTDPLAEFELIIDKFKRTITKQFNALGEIQLSSVTRLKDQTEKARQDGVMGAEEEPDLKKKRETKKASRGLDPISVNDKIKSVLADFDDYIDKLNLGTITFPTDPTKLNPKPPTVIPPILSLAEKASKGEFALESKPIDFKKVIKKFSKAVDPTKINTLKKNFNINKNEDFAAFKTALKDFSKEVLEYVQGNKVQGEDVDPDMPAEKKAEIAKANALRKKTLQKAFALSVLAIKPPKLQLFDPAAPCCAIETEEDAAISPQALAALAVFNALFDAILSGLTIDSLKQMLGGITEFGLDMITTFFDMLLDSLPPLNLPSLPDFAQISQVLLAPILTAIHTPQALNPLGLPFPIQVNIPISAIIKPLLIIAIQYLLELILRLLLNDGSLLRTQTVKLNTPSLEEIVKTIPCGDNQFATVKTTNSSTRTTIILPNGKVLKLPKIPSLALDIAAYFVLLTPTDLLQLVKDLIFVAIDGILEPIKQIVTPILAIAKTLKDLSFNIIEASNPFILPLKLAIMALKLQIPNSMKTRIVNLDALKLIQLAYIPVATKAEPVLKETLYLVSVLSCAFGSKPGILAARTAANPFVNQDDLPPWERLTHKNPLFAIFLDEILWRSTLVSTGSLIFQTKMPGLYPIAYTPNVFIDPGVHF